MIFKNLLVDAVITHWLVVIEDFLTVSISFFFAHVHQNIFYNKVILFVNVCYLKWIYIKKFKGQMPFIKSPRIDGSTLVFLNQAFKVSKGYHLWVTGDIKRVFYEHLEWFDLNKGFQTFAINCFLVKAIGPRERISPCKGVFKTNDKKGWETLVYTILK